MIEIRNHRLHRYPHRIRNMSHLQARRHSPPGGLRFFLASSGCGRQRRANALATQEKSDCAPGCAGRLRTPFGSEPFASDSRDREVRPGRPAGPKPSRSPPLMPLISFARRAMRAGLLLMTLAILTGCATTTASVGTDAVACSAFEPIRWSKKDTDDTIRQVKEHNAAWTAICRPYIAGSRASQQIVHLCCLHIPGRVVADRQGIEVCLAAEDFRGLCAS